MMKIFYALITAALLLVYMIVGTMDYADAQAEQARYCAMVEAGAWPDYREIYDDYCEERP